MTFEKNQRVSIVFESPALTLLGTVVENIDHTCKPLTNMWLVRLDTGATIGFSGKALIPA